MAVVGIRKRLEEKIDELGQIQEQNNALKVRLYDAEAYAVANPKLVAFLDIVKEELGGLQIRIPSIFDGPMRNS